MKNILAIVAVVLLGAGIFWVTGNVKLPEPTPVTYPAPTSYVVDDGNVLSADTESKLKADLTVFDKTAQIAVVTVRSLQGLSIEEYSINLADKWKVGYAGADNGVILLVAVDDRKVRIEVGRGLEGQLTDSEAGRILDNDVIPHLKNNEWDQGVLAGVAAIEEEVK